MEDEDFMPAEPHKRARDDVEEEGDFDGDDAPAEDENNIFEDESMPIGKQFTPGGSLHDYFFSSAPRWTVGNALNRILTKVKNNPEASMTVQKFVKDSCKGNLKKYFNNIRESMPHPEQVVMAEIAYLSFLQLSKGDTPYIVLQPPKNPPRTRAAAVSEDGYAYKDYTVKVTKAGFDIMQAKMSALSDNELHQFTINQNGEGSGDERSDQPPQKRRRMNSTKPTPRRSTSVQMPLSVATSQPGFVPRITEQEQEAANNMLLFVKASSDGFLATIHHLRSDNDQLRKENLALKFVNETLMEDVRVVKLQLAANGIIPNHEIEPLYNHPELGAHKEALQPHLLAGHEQAPQ